MNALWWLALPVLVLPILWHRRKKIQNAAAPLATARFLPRTEPLQTRTWRWRDLLLLLLRCLLLATLIAWLANPVFPTRGDTVVVTEGADSGWIAAQLKDAQLAGAEQVTLAPGKALAWLHEHQGQFKPDARIVVLGDVPMPATRPRFTRAVELRAAAGKRADAPLSVHIASGNPAWRRMFAALGSRVRIDDAPTTTLSLVVWDRPEAPPPGLKATLWLATQAQAFPELANARTLDGLKFADQGSSRVWHHPDWPPATVEQARALLEQIEYLHRGPGPIMLASQVFAADGKADAPAPEGALRDLLLIALIVLFVLERSLAHAARR